MKCFRGLFSSLRDRWKSYKYRFVPWVALNVKKNFRYVTKDDNFAKEEDVTSTLQMLFQTFYDCRIQMESRNKFMNDIEMYSQNQLIVKEKLGFCIEKSPSKLVRGGLGVVVSDGLIRKGHLAALYPGTVYRPSEALFLQSIGNSFIFRCADGIFIDGNDRSISKYIYKSCVRRDQIGPFLVADLSWLTNWPHNPLSIGQYVNNFSKGFECNVIYQEFNIPKNFPLHLRSYLPNIYNTSLNDLEGLPNISDSLPWIRIVGLLAVRDIHKDEELFSSYYTILD